MKTTGAWLLLSLMALSLSCTAPPDCFTPRPAAPSSCVTLERLSLVLRAGEFSPELESLCSHECIDHAGLLSVQGYTSLTEVPLLAKMREVGDLEVFVDTVTDLRGLESVRVKALSLQGNARRGGVEPPARLSSLQGLRQESLPVLVLSDTYGTLSGSELRHVDRLSLSNVGAVDIDVSSFTLGTLVVSSSHELQSIRLGGGTMGEVNLQANSELTSREWDPSLRVTSRVDISRNRRLSTCRARAFADATRDTRDAGTDRVEANGPCP